jgi:hypothetical protein
VRIKGNCIGDHDLVLACRGKDTRANLGRIRVRIAGKRIYGMPAPPTAVDGEGPMMSTGQLFRGILTKK